MKNLSNFSSKIKTPIISPLRLARAETLAAYLSVSIGSHREFDDELCRQIRSRFGWSTPTVDRAINDAARLKRLALRPWADHGDAGIRISLTQGGESEADRCPA